MLCSGLMPNIPLAVPLILSEPFGGIKIMIKPLAVSAQAKSRVSPQKMSNAGVPEQIAFACMSPT
jgi:hypothetical protein